MKIKDGFMLSRVAGSYVVVPVGAVQADFTGMITPVSYTHLDVYKRQMHGR